MNVIWFSCGCTSAVSSYLALKKYPCSEVIYIDTGGEHYDNKRFIRDCELWFDHKIKILKSNKYVDNYDVYRRTKFLNSPFGARCTLELKKKVRWKLEDENVIENQFFGFDISERKRAQRFKEQYPNAHAQFPLIDAVLSKQDCLAILKKEGIEIPTMYKLGFHNNNCIGCVKGSRGYWALIREKFPSKFKEMVEIENYIGKSCINGLFLKDLPDDCIKMKPIVEECSIFCNIEFLNN